jgi:rubrerythrin
LDDERLSDGAKLMYGKIARLAFKTGECWASNSFLDGTKTGRNSSRFIAELKNTGYIIIENEGSKYRKIKICSIKSVVNTSTSPEMAGLNSLPRQSRRGNQNNQSNLAKFGEVENTSTSPEMAGLNSLPRQSRRGNQNNQSNLAKFGDKTSSSSLNITTTSASDPPESHAQPPPPNEAAADTLSPQKLKEAVAAVDPCLILSEDFYPKAASFMAANGLDVSYLSWLYAQCKKQNPRSIRGLFYTLFFEGCMTEIYKASKLPRPEALLRPPDIPCPVCGTLHTHDLSCPSCGLPENASKDRISLFRQLHTFPPEKREEYLRREEEINQQCGMRELEKFNSLISDLNKEFHLETA